MSESNPQKKIESRDVPGVPGSGSALHKARGRHDRSNERYIVLHSHISEYPIYIRKSNLNYFYREYAYQRPTVVMMNGGSYCWVAETPEQILELLRGKS